MTDKNMPSSAEHSEMPAALSRRAWVGVAAGAALLGAGGSWWFHRRTSDPVDHALDALWAQTFTGPQGEPVPMAQFRGRKLVINFWATWCPPCVEELPMLNAFFIEQQAKGWTVLGLAVDQLEPVQRFLTRQPLAFPVAVLGAQGLTVTQSLGNAAGSLPYTAVLAADGSWVQRKLGKVNENDLAAWAALP